MQELRATFSHIFDQLRASGLTRKHAMMNRRTEHWLNRHLRFYSKALMRKPTWKSKGRAELEFLKLTETC